MDTTEADKKLEEKLREPIIAPLAPPHQVVIWFRYKELREKFDKFWEERRFEIINRWKLKGKRSPKGEMPSGQRMAEKQIGIRGLYGEVLAGEVHSRVPDILFVEGMELFDFEEGKTPQLVSIVYFYPKLTLRQEINWGCKKPPEPDRQAHFENRLRELQMQFRKLEDDPDGTITEQSNVQMDLIATIEGKPHAAGTLRAAWVDVSGIPMKGLVQCLQGHKVGDLFECDYEAHPRDSEAAGKTIHAVVKILNLQKIIVPPVDDELAKDAEFDSLEAFEERFHKDFDQYLQNRRKGVVADHVINHIMLNSAVPPIPQGLVSLHTQALAAQHVRNFGGNKKAAMKAVGAQDEKDFAPRFTGQVYRELMQQMAFRKYGELFNVKPNSDEMYESMLDNVKWLSNEEEKKDDGASA